jgi:hypothetical protein
LCEIGDDAHLRQLHLALSGEVERRKSHIFMWLCLHHDADLVRKLRKGLRDASMEQRAYALELVEVLVSAALKQILLPLLDDFSNQQRLRKLRSAFPQEKLRPAERLRAIIAAPVTQITSWTRACAIHAAGMGSAASLSETLQRATRNEHPMIRETALWALEQASAGRKLNSEVPNAGA